MVCLLYIIIIIIIITPPTLPKPHIATAEAVSKLAECYRHVLFIAADRNPPQGKRGR